MPYTVKTYKGDDQQVEKIKHLLDVCSSIVEDYFVEPYDEIVRSKSYSAHQIAAAYIYMGYYALRGFDNPKNSSDLFDLIAFCSKERIEDLITKTGSDPFKKRMS